MKKLIGRKRGFTLIELLVVVLILAILMAVALPLYLSAVADSERKSCRANMQTIANAVQARRVKDRLANYSTFYAAVSTALEPDLQAAPLCPVTGTNTYTVEAGAAGGTGVYRVRCTNSSGGVVHGTFEPGIDGS